jgi:hypothetical protein
MLPLIKQVALLRVDKIQPVDNFYQVQRLSKREGSLEKGKAATDEVESFKPNNKLQAQKRAKQPNKILRMPNGNRR